MKTLVGALLLVAGLMSACNDTAVDTNHEYGVDAEYGHPDYDEYMRDVHWSDLDDLRRYDHQVEEDWDNADHQGEYR